jgi:hypothetical protein
MTEISVAAPLEGGCQCGAVRFRVTAPPVSSGYCHCRMCQKSSGGPAQVSGEFPVAAFALTKGAFARYQSSASAARLFCPICGAQVAWVSGQTPDIISINLPSLDHPEAVIPTIHIWYAERFPGFDMADDLPKEDGAGE